MGKGRHAKGQEQLQPSPQAGEVRDRSREKRAHQAHFLSPQSRWRPQRAQGKQGQQWWVLTVAEPPAPGICSPGEPQAAARTRWRSGAGGMVSTYRVAVLGARGVGKSAIVRQFLYNEFSEACVPTTARRLYLPAVVMNGHVHDLQILDFPPISTFPVNTLQVRGPTGAASRGVGGWGRELDSHLLRALSPSEGSEGAEPHHGPPRLEPSFVLHIYVMST